MGCQKLLEDNNFKKSSLSKMGSLSKLFENW